MSRIDTVCVEITARCPLQCVHCSADAGPDKTASLSAEAFRQLVGKLGHVKELYISGGEPFEHPELAAIVAHARGLADLLVVYTSGTSLSAGGAVGSIPAAAIARAMTNGVARFDVSLYAATAREHDAVTQRPGSYHATLQTLTTFRLLGAPFGVHYVPVSGRGADVLRVAALAREFGASRFHVLALVAQGRAATLKVAPDGAFVAKMRDVRSSNGFEVLRSSAIRRAMGDAATERDAWHATFVDVHGDYHPSEGRRALNAPDVTSPADIARELMSLN
jgi:MoaA/NifB/PqqE/SkfB family radical SAM enzyme